MKKGIIFLICLYDKLYDAFSENQSKERKIKLKKMFYPNFPTSFSSSFILLFFS